MNRHDQLLDRLARNARRDAAPRATNEMPHGFATRVLAEVRADAGRSDAWWWWERLTLRAIPVAAALLVICALLVPRARTVAADSSEQLANEIFAAALKP